MTHTCILQSFLQKAQIDVRKFIALGQSSRRLAHVAVVVVDFREELSESSSFDSLQDPGAPTQRPDTVEFVDLEEKLANVVQRSVPQHRLQGVPLTPFHVHLQHVDRHLRTNNNKQINKLGTSSCTCMTDVFVLVRSENLLQRRHLPAFPRRRVCAMDAQIEILNVVRSGEIVCKRIIIFLFLFYSSFINFCDVPNRCPCLGRTTEQHMRICLRSRPRNSSRSSH